MKLIKIYLIYQFIIFHSILLSQKLNESNLSKFVSSPNDQVNLEWAQRYGSKCLSSDDRLHAMTIDKYGCIYLTGEVSKSSGGNKKYAILKYSPAGDLVMELDYDNDYFMTAKPYAIAVDNSCNVYVTGSRGIHSYMTVKFNENGVEQWVREFYGAGYDNIPVAIKIDKNGNVYVTGYSLSQTKADFATIKYSSNGDEQWTAYYNEPEAGNDYPVALEVDLLGNVYVSGASDGNLCDDQI